MQSFLGHILWRWIAACLLYDTFVTLRLSLDWSKLYELVEPLYCEDNGRPSIDPVVLFKMVLIQHLYDLPSLRRTADEISLNVAYRWFLGYRLQEETPHFSTVSYNFKHRFTPETVSQIFDWILREIAEAGYLYTYTVFVDGTYIKANANNKKTVTLDALDLICSGMVNNTDEGALIYWVLKNAGGMSDLDDVKFVERLKTIGVIHTEDGVEAMPHQLEAPVDSSQATIDMLTKRLYTDFQAFDASAVASGNQTATAIRASYVPLDLKVDKFESQVTEFILGILKIAGIDDKPSYTRNKIVNAMEEVQTVLMCDGHLPDEYITKKVLTVMGDVDQFEQIQNQKTAEESRRITNEDVSEDA